MILYIAAILVAVILLEAGVILKQRGELARVRNAEGVARVQLEE